jgi:hypothetical protein
MEVSQGPNWGCSANEIKKLGLLLECLLKIQWENLKVPVIEQE